MPNAKDVNEASVYQRLLVAGRTGSGKTAQIWTLPGKKFAYIFDPNSMATLKGCDLDYEEYLPDFLELDATLKGFNKGAKSDKPRTPRSQPTVYMTWIEDINTKVANGYFKDYQWLIFDSLTFLTKAVMDRQLYLNNRYGDIEERADYRVVGSKVSDVYTSICSLPINIYATGHIRAFEDEATHRVETQLNLPGKSRQQLPLMFTNIWLATVEETDKGQRYFIRTKPDPRGLRDIRSSIQGLETLEDVTLNYPGRTFLDQRPGEAGIGALLTRSPKAGKVVGIR